MGLDARACRALAQTERLWTAPNSRSIIVRLMLLGDRRELAQRVPGFASSRHWTSVTPFVPTRHVKPRGRNTLDGQIQAQIESWGYPPAIHIATVDDPVWRKFWVKRRETGKAPPIHLGIGIRITFDSIVEGPMCLGYGAHFGLGQLEPFVHTAS